ncbi:hypothetical protein QJS10_CPB11g00329 [Acorus calamus]|uniref:Agenet domain-containing protein n=1 Tax=Acorus calamus TaxID=4465 RepID=A0AAV9DT52_ACOCL|nr:hypothetical protein QJS10_CPB11g00329 [Acorus calamus]
MKIAAGHASPAEHVINHQPVSTGAAPENAIEFCSGFDHSDKEGEVQQDDGFLKAASGLTPGSSREHCLAAAPVEMESVEKNVDPTHLNELQASVDAAISNVSDTKLERISSSVSSVIEKKIDFASESVLHGKFEDVVSLGTGDAANSDLEKAPSYTKNNVKSISVETGHSCPNTFETKCGPSNVIGSDHSSRNKNEHIENNENSFDQNCAASDGVPCIPYEHGRNPGSTDAADNDPKKLNVSKDGGSFSFEVRSIENPPENDDGKRWEPSCSAQPAEMAQVKERPPATTDMPQPTNVKLKETARGNQLASDEEKPQGDASMDIDEARKTVSLSGSSSEKVSATKDKPVRESSRSKHLVGKEDNSCSTSTNSVRCIARDTKIEGVSRYAYHEDSVKSSCAPLIQASTLPDLNSSFSAATLFRQPFTDLQQVQLRAQIIVYGSLIQGVPPDEACMISAFGGTDGGRGTWESAWRAAAERFHNQRSPLSNFETPVLLHSGIRITEQTSRSSPIHSKSHVSPACRAGTKISPLTTLNPAVSLQSPLWNITTPLHDGLYSSMPRGPFQDSHRAISAFPSYQSPQVRPYVGSGGPWPSQSPASGTWAIPQTSAVDASGQFAALPILETVQGTPIHDSSIPFASNMQVVSPNVYPSAASVSFSSVSAAHSEAQVVSVTAGKHLPGESKSRKRKKSMASGVTQISSASQTQAEPPAIGVTVHLPSSSPLSTANQSDKPICGLAATSSPVISSANCQVIGRGDAQGDGLSDDTCSKLEQAKQNAIDAAALAASAVRHSQDVWNKLANHNNSNSVPELEAKLVSAAAAIGAAASVAKAAAAAAKVACDAALQAKMMADEALGVIKVGHTTQNVEASVSDGGRNLGRVSPASILKGKEKMNGSSSVLVTALETSRKRVEETSAATKRAENLAAVMRAAELAADAVSQAGAVVAMGDPVPLSSSDLVDAGVDGYWKLLKLTGDSIVKTNNIPIRQPQPDASGSFEGNDENHNKHHSNEKEVRPPSTSTSEKELGYKGRKLSRMSKPAKVVSGMVIGSGNELRRDQSEDILNGSSIKEGSSVEVLSGGIWYSARVLNLKDGMVYVCYAEHGTDEGSGQLKEWLPLRDDKAPRVRIARPVHASKYEGTRKRKKSDVWNVGDQVDVWTGFGWRGGVVKEKSKIDETLLTVYFPVGDDLSTVREWDLRASLIWKDGEWMEWSRLRDYKSVPNQGDTPTAKHHKLDRPEHGFAFQPETGEKVFSKHSVIEGLKKPEEVKPLPLSEKDRLFSLGKDVKGDNNSDALRMKRTGLQKAGSGVIFGIPKPGKKRKFMDVSKHYNSNGASKVKEVSDHNKTEKHMMSQATRGWKPPPKPDPKRKQAGDAKSKMMKPGKSQSIQNTADKGSSSVSEGTIHDALPNVQILSGNEENRLEKHKQTETGSVSDSLGTAGERETSSLQSAVKEASSSRRKPVLAGGLPLGPKAKIGTGAENAGRGVVKDPDSTENRPNSALEPIEPRRSNRRIQPTPKFLEGLQSSLIITKIPSISHDRTMKSLRRSTASSRSRRQG